MPSAVIYCRVSTAEQVDNTSLSTQESACCTWCERNGLDIARVYVDRGESAKSADRPAFLRMVTDCQRKPVDRVVVYRLDRFARNTLDHGVYAHKLKQAGATLASVCEPIADDPGGRMMENIYAAVAQFDNDVRSARARDAMRAIKAAGGWVHKAPFGFRIVRREDNLPVLDVDPDAAPVIKRAFAMVRDGQSPQSAFEALRPPVGRSTFYRAFRDPLYARIDAVGYQEVQAMIGQTRARTRRSNEFPLRGLFICAHCGYKLTASEHKGRVYYHCKRSGHASINDDQVNAWASDVMSQLSGVFQLAIPAMRVHIERQAEEAAVERADIMARSTNELAKAQRHMDKLVAAMLDDKLPAGYYDRRRGELEADIARAQADIEAGHKPHPDETLPAIAAEQLVDLESMWNANPARRARMLTLTFPRGVVVDGREVRTSASDSIFGVLCSGDTGFFRLAPPTGCRWNEMAAAIKAIMEVAA